MSAQRSWYAKVQYPGYAVFHFGTALTARSDGEEAARVALQALMDTTRPRAMQPAILSVHPGCIVVVDE